MKASMMLIAAATFGLLCAQPARSDDCNEAMQRIEDATEVADKAMELEMADLTRNKPQNDQELASLKNRLCSTFGEFLGVARVTRLASDECLSGNKRRATISSLDGSIKQMEDSILKTCR